MTDDTPIYDIKPYITYTDSRPDAKQSFAGDFINYGLKVDFPEKLLSLIPDEKQAGIIGILRHDPRPAYQDSPTGYTVCVTLTLTCILRLKIIY